MSTSTTPVEDTDASEQPGPSEPLIKFLPPFVKLTMLGSTDSIFIEPDGLVCFYPRQKVGTKPGKGTYVHVAGIESAFLVEETPEQISALYTPSDDDV